MVLSLCRDPVGLFFRLSRLHCWPLEWKKLTSGQVLSSVHIAIVMDWKLVTHIFPPLPPNTNIIARRVNKDVSTGVFTDLFVCFLLCESDPWLLTKTGGQSPFRKINTTWEEVTNRRDLTGGRSIHSHYYCTPVINLLVFFFWGGGRYSVKVLKI